MANRPALRVTLDGVQYPVDEWRTIESGGLLKEEWVDGFVGGAGDYYRTRRDSYYCADGFDGSRYPFASLRPSVQSTATANLDVTNYPMYAFYADSGGVNYLYVVNQRYAFKYTAAGATLHSTFDFGATAVAGRPAFFEGVWYVPLGTAVNARKLTAIGVGAAADTWTDVGVLALHFAATQKDGIAQLARAHSTNNIDLSADGTTFGDDFEVGNSSSFISDLLPWLSELAVIKPDAPYVFAPSGGSSYPVQEIISAPNVSRYHGSNSHVYGPYLYWCPLHTLWRIHGSRADQIDPTADPRWLHAELDSFPPIRQSTGGGWFRTSVAAYGKWLYFQVSDQVWGGQISEDGRVVWHGSIFTATVAGRILRIAIAQGTTATPKLIIAEDTTDTVHFMVLSEDGAPQKHSLLNAARGDLSTTFRMVLPNLDFGEPTKQKQLRRMAVMVNGFGATAPLQLTVYRDRAGSSEDVGATITADGFNERRWTPGTNDLAFEVQPQFEVVTTAGYSSSGSDPRIRYFLIEAASRSVYRCVIPATVQGLNETAQTVNTVIQALRNLRNKGTFTCIEPHGLDTFTAEIIGIEEEVTQGGGNADGDGIIMTLHLERWDYGS